MYGMNKYYEKEENEFHIIIMGHLIRFIMSMELSIHSNIMCNNKVKPVASEHFS